MRTFARFNFSPQEHKPALLGIIRELDTFEKIDSRTLTKVLKRYPKGAGLTFSKSDIIRGVRAFSKDLQINERAFVAKLRMKPVRTQSGVAPVTVLTKPFPCPGQCIFCPNDVRMPKSYLSMEPGAQRATQNRFDPFAQTMSRLKAFHINGHQTDKVEMIILGGTWSFYPESYQVWFIQRCFEAMNRFEGEADRSSLQEAPHLDFLDLDTEVNGRSIDQKYNEIISDYLKVKQGALVSDFERSDWPALYEAHRINESAQARCVGLVVETRPDHISEAEVIRIRKLGATKVQLGYQSLSDEVLTLNKRGHDVAATRRAMRLLRTAGFKIHAHWMPNLYGSSPERDIEDFARIFDDPDFRPDELKIYPCALIESAELMKHYERGEWQPYSHEVLLEVLAECMRKVPPYCRTTRVIRDIPSHDIVVGNKLSNLREFAEQEMSRRDWKLRDIRSREIRGEEVKRDALRREELRYDTNIGEEIFIQEVTEDDRIVGFCRLSLPKEPGFIEEIAGSAMIREVHVYGSVVGLSEGQTGGRSQHRGIGSALVERAAELATQAGYSDLAVISAIGTRGYYRELGFADAPLYLHRALSGNKPA